MNNTVIDKEFFCSQCGTTNKVNYTIFNGDLICVGCWGYRRTGNKNYTTQHLGDIDP